MLVGQIELCTDELKEPLFIKTPVGRSTEVTRICRSCVLANGGVELEFDLLVLGMTGFEAILGMDWLSAYQITLDCLVRSN